jgi:hypothetical protein
MRVIVVIPTYEPDYIYNPQLEDFYTQNFDSFLSPDGDVDLKLIITDFKSSKLFKYFLRRYIVGRKSCFLIDGEQEGCFLVACNIALRSFNFDYAVYAASDVRARDRQWLGRFLKDFEDPRVHVVTATVTSDGLEVYGQNQPGPIERESRTLHFPEVFNIHCAIFSGRFLQHYDNRFPDISDTNQNEAQLPYLLAALGYLAKVNFRVNVIHDRFHAVRHNRVASSSWRVKNRLYEADHQKIETRSIILPRPYFFSSRKVSPIERLRMHIGWLKTQGWRYFFYRYFSQRVFDNFGRLDSPTKVAILKALVYRPEADYAQYTYSICGSQSEVAEWRSSDHVESREKVSG